MRTQFEWWRGVGVCACVCVLGKEVLGAFVVMVMVVVVVVKRDPLGWVGWRMGGEDGGDGMLC